MERLVHKAKKQNNLWSKLEKKLIYSDRISGKIEIEYWDERMTTLSATRMLIDADMRREKEKKSWIS